MQWSLILPSGYDVSPVKSFRSSRCSLLTTIDSSARLCSLQCSPKTLVRFLHRATNFFLLRSRMRGQKLSPGFMSTRRTKLTRPSLQAEFHVACSTNQEGEIFAELIHRKAGLLRKTRRRMCQK